MGLSRDLEPDVPKPYDAEIVSARVVRENGGVGVAVLESFCGPRGRRAPVDVLGLELGLLWPTTTYRTSLDF